MTTPQKRLVPIAEAREVLGGIGTTTIYELFKRGELTKVNIGRRGFVTSESLDAFLQRLSDEAASADAAAVV
ncbi:helix-turn-helix transcriptional regulator [Mycobacterium sp. BMJ-28]